MLIASADRLVRGGRPAALDFLLGLTLWTIAITVASAFGWLLFDILSNGLSQISFEFFFSAPKEAGRAGGIAPIIISTLLILLVCLAVSLPLGLATAVLLSEFTAKKSGFARCIRRSLDVLAGVPSIVFGLFGNAFFCIYLGMGFSILSGGLTLACMVMPILIRSTEEGFRSVPDEYRTGAAALSLSRTTTLTSILLPAAVPGLVVGTVLGVGRALAETAALIFTSGYVDRMPESLLDSGRSLSIHIFDLSMNIPGGDSNAYASALVLISLLLAVNISASYLGNRFLRKV